MLLFAEHRVDDTVRSCPFSEHEAVVESSRIHTFVAFAYTFGKSRIIVHSEVEIKRVFLVKLLYPFRIEPVSGVVGVAVEPHFRAVHGASCQSLFHERTRHESDFIEEYSRKRHALYKCRGAFVLAAEEVYPVGLTAESNVEVVAADLFGDDKAVLRKQRK